MPQLIMHPDSRCAAVTRMEADAVRTRDGALELRYVVTGKIGGLRLPPVAASARVGGLWQHTCFEAFVRAAPGPAYLELNFAPSTQWVAYAFSAYRAGMTDADDVGAPTIDVRATAESLEVQVSLALKRLADVPCRLALSAVMEETNGDKSYWALAHPPGKPDFHHADAFILEI